MRRSRVGLLVSAVILVVLGSLPGIALADPTPSGQTSQHDMLSSVLHGEGTVQTKKGPVRVAMQKGTATAATSRSLTVRSADGYTKTWALDKNVKVLDKRKGPQPEALQAGSDVVVGGPITTSGGTAKPSTIYTAQIVLVQSSPSAPAGSPS
ncbi:hypothetical protein [Dactylosporangium sp. NPDC005555]|uniref:hypothetical protein n=1 Tax=Dactylosporangium sp. NPDC005555 TaxID=3154889 RepID=UPI0033B93105